MTTSTDSRTLYERIGGKEAIRTAVDRFYVSVLQDEDLAPFFAKVSMKLQQEQQRRFLTQALGGPAVYRGRGMLAAHSRHRITQRHFDLVAGHLVATLSEIGVDEELIAEIVSVVGPLASQIVNSKEPNVQKPSYGAAVLNSDHPSADEAEHFASMLEGVPINVIFADRDCIVRYANRTSTETLKTIEHLIPIRAEQLIGTCIDVFHKDPGRIRRLLDDPRNLPHKAQIRLGEETLSLDANAVMSRDGEYIGAMVAWAVITSQIKQEKDLADAQRREREAAESLRVKVDAMLRVVQAAAEGDLTQDVPVKGEDAIGQMGEGLTRFLKSMRASIGEMASNAQTLAGASEELTSVSQQMNANSEVTSAQARSMTETSKRVSENVQTVAAGTEEMSASIQEIARNANEAAGIASEAVTVAEETNVTVGRLGESSAEIGQVIKVITSIAQQTNLLALNATIEAARAGDAGRGFAVVANEVKELAKETAKATEDISRKIETIQGTTRDSVAAIEKISAIIGRISHIQSSIACAVEQQTATTNEMARNVSDASRDSSGIVDSMADVAEATADTSRGTSEVEKSASELARMASDLQRMVQRFHF